MTWVKSTSPLEVARGGRPAPFGQTGGADVGDDPGPRRAFACEREAVDAGEALDRGERGQRAVVVDAAPERFGDADPAPPARRGPGRRGGELGDAESVLPVAGGDAGDLVVGEQPQPAAVAVTGAVGPGQVRVRVRGTRPASAAARRGARRRRAGSGARRRSRLRAVRRRAPGRTATAPGRRRRAPVGASAPTAPTGAGRSARRWAAPRARRPPGRRRTAAW